MVNHINNTNEKSFSAIYLVFIRFLSIVSVITLLRGVIGDFFTLPNNTNSFQDKLSTYSFLTINISTIICFIILFIKPDKLPLCSLISFIYGLGNLINPSNIGEVGIGFSMMLLFYSSLWVQGFYKKHRLVKTIISILSFVTIILANFIYGIQAVEYIFRYILGYSIIFSVIVLMLTKHFIESKHSILGRKILDLRKYISDGSLNDRDVMWLKMILNRDKYSAIANQTSVAEGTMRNRIREVFKIIGVTDKKQFLTIYDEALVITTQEEFQAWKDTLV